MPYFICPNCRERSIDHDRQEGLSRQAVACHRCGFGFLFELMDDYYPAPGTGFVVCDQQSRILASGRGVRRPLVDAAEQAERLESIDGRGGEVVAGAPLDLGLA